MKNPTIAIILGGGRGSRLHPLTGHRSKPAVPIAGKYRLVDIPISNCLNSGIRKIYVLTQFNSASLNRHIKNTYNFDAFSSGFVDILAAEQTPKSQTWFQGTADAVRQSLHHLENHQFEYVLILSGDQLYQMDFNALINEHKKNKADLTIATIPVIDEDATGFGILKRDEEYRIVSFKEKPALDELSNWKSPVPQAQKSQGKEYLASMGIYVFNKALLKQLMKENPEAVDFGKELIPKALQTSKVYSYDYTGYWTDIGTIRSFYEANLELTETLPSFNLYDNDNLIYTRARLLPASKISGTTLDRVLIAEGSIIEASRIVYSVIGIRSRIGKGTTVENCIIMGNDYFPTASEIAQLDAEHPLLGIGERCFISNAIIDKNVQIGNDVRIVGGPHLSEGKHGFFYVMDGIVILPKGAIVPDGTSI